MPIPTGRPALPRVFLACRSETRNTAPNRMTARRLLDELTGVLQNTFWSVSVLHIATVVVKKYVLELLRDLDGAAPRGAIAGWGINIEACHMQRHDICLRHHKRCAAGIDSPEAQ